LGRSGLLIIIRLVDNMMRIRVDTALSQNRLGHPKPLEDYVLIDNESKIFIILDGVSRDKVNGTYPNPSPSFEVSRIFSEEVLRFLKRVELLDDVKHWLKQAVLEGNKKIEEYNNRTSWDFLPGAVGIISLILGSKFYYMFVGDCSGRILRKGKTRLFTYPQTELIKKHRAEFSADEIRNMICNNKNHPYGYGVFTGESGVIDFLEFGVEPLHSGDLILLTTDGMDELLSSEGFQITCPISAKELITRAEELEKNQMTLKSDDKAVISIRLE
jgi:serine/threonine protein phosphatase PrpC